MQTLEEILQSEFGGEIWPANDKRRMISAMRTAVEQALELAAGEWVSVEERLPELEETVLLFDDWMSTGKNPSRHQDVRTGYLYSFSTYKTTEGVKNTCEWLGTEYAFNITHWRKLPAFPSEILALKEKI